MPEPEDLQGKDAPGADPDLALVERIQAGDRRAFETLVRRHEGRVFRTALAVAGNEADAEEAMQDTFLKAFQHLGEFRGDSRFSTWLTRIAINEGLQRTRRKREMVSLDDPEHSLEAVLPRRTDEWASNPEKLCAARETKDLVEKAIRALPPPYRVVFVLRDVEQLSTEETSAAIGLSIPGVKSRLLRARLMLREALAPTFEQAPTLRKRLYRAGMNMRNMLQMGLDRVARRAERR